MPRFLQFTSRPVGRIKRYIERIVDARIAEVTDAHIESILDARLGPHLQSFYRMTGAFAGCLTPGLASPNALFGSSLCRMEDMVHPAYGEICRRDLKREPVLHRKQWEFIFIIHKLRSNGCLLKGRRGLGFGVGTEPLPSFFVSCDCSILASDAPDSVVDDGWKQTAQHANTLHQLWHQDIVDLERFEAHCQFQPLDMTSHEEIPSGFDFHWSSCVIEHLGGIRAAQDFILASAALLAPGGTAVHTTEFNLSSDDETIDLPGTCILRGKDIRKLEAKLLENGCKLDPIILDPGTHPYNFHVDSPPYSAQVHLRLLLEQYASTSIGLVIHKPA